jgi:hypothetical protein
MYMYLSARRQISKSVEPPSLGVDILNHDIKGPELCVPDSDIRVTPFFLLFSTEQRKKNLGSQTQDNLVRP